MERNARCLERVSVLLNAAARFVSQIKLALLQILRSILRNTPSKDLNSLKLVNVEKHKFDTTFATTVGSTPAVTNLVAISQGDGEGARTGNSLLAKYAYITLNMIRSSSSTQVSDTVRVVVVVDKRTSRRYCSSL